MEAQILKKAYTLDYSIQRDTDRVAAVKQILSQLEKPPTPDQLDQMGSYILYGKDEEGYNAVQRGQVTDGHKRYATFKKKDDKNLSLDQLLQNPSTNQQDLHPANIRRPYTNPKPVINHPKFDKKTGELLDPGDSDIPGMRDLWQSIERIEKLVAINEGKLPPDENTYFLPDSYRLYQLKHQLADLRKHQYYLKDAYKPTIHFMAADKPRAQFVDWTADSFYWVTQQQWQQKVDDALLSSISKNLKDYEVRQDGMIKWVVRQHTFDWENPAHIRALINNYQALYEYMHEKFQTYGRTLIFDFQRYRQMCNFSPIRNALLDMKIKKMVYPEIIEELLARFGLKYNENYLSNIFAREIPNAIAITAKKNRLLIETPIEEQKACIRCGRVFPRDTVFFGVNNSRKDHFSSVCKECEKKRRIERGVQNKYDKRSKDPTLHAMQVIEARK